MKDILINSARSNVLLPARKMVKSSTSRDVTETKHNNESSKNEPVKKDEMNVDLEKTVKKVKEFAKTFTTKLSFAVDPMSKDSVIYVTNKETGKIIRQIPPEDIQKMTARMDEIVGILFSGRV